MPTQDERIDIAFLDIDGVFNSNEWYQSDMYGWLAGSPSPKRHFDPEPVELFNILIRETKAKVVISSSWRTGRSVEELQAIFDEVGIEATVVGRIGELGDIETLRGQVIERFMEKHGEHIRNYVIIDDHNDMMDHQLPHFVKTDKLKRGFSYADLQKAKSILTR